MKKLLAVAAMAGIMAAGFAAPLPAIAAEVPAHCAVLPLLKADCRAAIRAAADDGSVTVVAAARTVRSSAAGAVETAASTAATVAAGAVDSVTGWSCVRTKGSKALFACSR